MGLREAWRRKLALALTAGDPSHRANVLDPANSRLPGFLRSTFVARLGDPRVLLMLGGCGAGFGHFVMATEATTPLVGLETWQVFFGAVGITYFTIDLARSMATPRSVKDYDGQPPAVRVFRARRMMPSSIVLMAAMGIQVVSGNYQATPDWLLSIALVVMILALIGLVVAALLRGKRSVRISLNIIRLTIGLAAVSDVLWSVRVFGLGHPVLAGSVLVTAIGIGLSAVVATGRDIPDEIEPPAGGGEVVPLRTAA